MSLTHCPLCVGLAVLSAVRFMAHGLMLWQWLGQGQARWQWLGQSSQEAGVNQLPWQPRPAVFAQGNPG